MGKLNRSKLLEKVGTVSSIGLVGPSAVGQAHSKDEAELSNKEKARADQVLKIVNRADLSEAAKKEKLKKIRRRDNRIRNLPA